MAKTRQRSKQALAGILYVERRFTKRGAELAGTGFLGYWEGEGIYDWHLCCQPTMSGNDIYQIMESNLCGYVHPEEPFRDDQKKWSGSTITMLYPVFLPAKAVRNYGQINQLLGGLWERHTQGALNATSKFIGFAEKHSGGGPRLFHDFLEALGIEIGHLVPTIPPLIPYGKSEIQMRDELAEAKAKKTAPKKKSRQKKTAPKA